MRRAHTRTHMSDASLVCSALSFYAIRYRPRMHAATASMRRCMAMCTCARGGREGAGVRRATKKVESQRAPYCPLVCASSSRRHGPKRRFRRTAR
jgi:hypothetical protein